MILQRPAILLLLSAFLLPGVAAAATPPVPASATRPAVPAPASGPVALQSRPGTPLDATARQLVADDLREAARSGERPLLLTGQARLGTAAADRPALFVQLQSPRECGSGGCNTSVWIWTAGRYQRVLDGAAGRLQVAATRHRGMADLVTENDTFLWNGTAYASKDPAPNIDLRPHTRPRSRRPAG